MANVHGAACSLVANVHGAACSLVANVHEAACSLVAYVATDWHKSRMNLYGRFIHRKSTADNLVGRIENVTSSWWMANKDHHEMVLWVEPNVTATLRKVVNFLYLSGFWTK